MPADGQRRRAGLLLHPTSLPGDLGSGELGPEAFRWLEFLEQAGQRLWQVLPLGPTGYGDSPYQSLSSFAGNPLLISLELLRDRGLLSDDELEPLRRLPQDRISFGELIPLRGRLLDLAAGRLLAAGEPAAFREFCVREADWLEDYVLFSTLKAANGGAAWLDWPEGERLRDPAALQAARERNAGLLERLRVQQWWFMEQWTALRAEANRRGIALLGDLPIFVALDSADAWAARELFDLDASGRPQNVAGVPPDYFSATGQRWGNPLYVWERHARDGFSWWTRRVAHNLRLFDELRIDHFRGFESFYSIPAEEPTAVRGEWLPGPGLELFRALEGKLGALPVIAEDLGVITPKVDALREACGFPGMKVLQFAFAGGPEDPYLPHNHVPRSVVYTGTHDNDTTAGWYATTTEQERDLVRRYFGVADGAAPWALLRAAQASVAELAIAPLQDVLGLGSEGRMNIPGQAGGNWSWRFGWEQPGDWAAAMLRELATLYGRLPD